MGEALQKSMPPVRLSQQEREDIKSAVTELARRHDFNWRMISLFGSRTKLHAKGGDIDLYVRLDSRKPSDVELIKRELRMLLHEKLGEQKIDIVIDDGHTNLGTFGQIVLQEKVDLWTKT